MSNDVVIAASGLGKKYRIGHASERAPGSSFRHAVSDVAAGIWGSLGNLAHGRPLAAGDASEDFWALKEVDFEVQRGDVLGIIGRNGAGKSTLLKILSRITEPTEGRVELRGRVASLLEVGTGFHPELTGRENIFLNGAILGMMRAEIRCKFDEIVDFAGVEKFLDTPVKRYSSGMYVRLAFAVAAHLDPEILIVDEVLAVGDAEFQKKCLGRMSVVAGLGRTVLFVSHNMSAVRSLCTRGLLLADGRAVHWSSTQDALDAYLNSGSIASDGALDWRWRDAERPGNSALRVRRVFLSQSAGKPTSEVFSDTGFDVHCEFEQTAAVVNGRVNLQFATALGEVAFTTSDHSARRAATAGPGIFTSRCRVPGRLFNIGRYAIRLSVDVPGVEVIVDWIEIGQFQVSGHHHGGTSFTDKTWPGVLSPECAWTVEAHARPCPSAVRPDEREECVATSTSGTALRQDART